MQAFFLTGGPRYYTHEDAERCVRYISGTKLDDRIIRTDWDTGFVEGRQYGRGKTGGQVCVKWGTCVINWSCLSVGFFVMFFLLLLQVRDDYRMDFDETRGGFGGGAMRQMQKQGVDPATLPANKAGGQTS